MPKGQKTTTKGNQRNVERFKKIYDRFMAQFIQTRNKIRLKYIRGVKAAFNQAKYGAIGDLRRTSNGDLKNRESFYAGYSPLFYRRRFDLVHIPELETDLSTGTFKYHFKSDNLRKWHRVYDDLGADKGQEYIFKLSFVDGFHGGARSGGTDAWGDPFPGSYDQPYWRWPGPPVAYPYRYSLWGKPARRSNSPALQLMHRFREDEKVLRMEAIEELQTITLGLLNKLREGYVRYMDDPDVLKDIDNYIKTFDDMDFTSQIKPIDMPDFK